MEKLLDYLVRNTLGLTDFEIKSTTSDEANVYELVVPNDSIGLVIGKKGRTIKMLRSLLKVKAILNKERFNLIITPK